MSNYQLARTNTYLSGQLKLDLTLNRSNDELYIEDFHMSPVSNYTGYAWGTDSELLNNRHSENISDYYAKTKNFFFEDCLNPGLDTKYPLYSPNYPIDTHDNDYLMGLYRLPRNVYNKSYAFFCPFWITDPTKFLETKFVFKVFKYRNLNPLDDILYMYTRDEWIKIFKNEYPQGDEESDEHYEERINALVDDKLQELEDNPIKVPVCRTSLNMHDIVGKDFHNKFVKYFDDYLKGYASHEYDIKETKFNSSNVVSDAYKLNIDGIDIKQKETSIEKIKAQPFLSSDLLYISLNEKKAWAKGIDPLNGTYSNKDISYICNTLLKMERPLLDTDYYISRIFKDNSLIAQQLINFNFIFDIADIVPAIVYEDIQYSRFGIEVYIYQKELIKNSEDDEYEMKRLSLKDFYSNYEFIPKTYIHNGVEGDYNSLYIDYNSEDNTMDNVLDYKNNCEFIDYIYKNKLIQNTIHWGIENSDYIFNIFDGFSPIIKSYENENYKIFNSSGNMPFISNISVNDFDAGEQNILWANYYSIILENPIDIYTNYQNFYTKFSIDNEWINGVKYDFSKINIKKIKNDILINYGKTVAEDDTIIENYLNSSIWVMLKYNGNINDLQISFDESLDGNFLISFSGKREKLTFQKVRDELSNWLHRQAPESTDARYYTINNILEIDDEDLQLSIINLLNKSSLKDIKLERNNKTKITKLVLPSNFNIDNSFNTYENEIKLNFDLNNIEIASKEFLIKYLLHLIMTMAIPQSAIKFDNTYIPKVAKSPSANTTEVNYKIINNSKFGANFGIIYRYDGKLEPFLINVGRICEDWEEIENKEEHLVNYSNYIIQYEENLSSIPEYNSFNNTLYQPNYPSIGYSSMANEIINYTIPNFIQYYGDTSNNIYRGERRWYDGSFMYFLPQNINITKQSIELTNNEIYNAFVTEILNRFEIYPTIEEEFAYHSRFIMNYILPLYNYYFDYEKLYVNGTNEPVLTEDKKHFIYQYKIKFELI